jgi:hypothetical protein
MSTVDRLKVKDINILFRVMKVSNRKIKTIISIQK